MFELYNLNPIALTVARTLPTGEKNALRKTYKGKIKDLNISGKFDVTVQPTPEDSMFAMMCVPDAEWHLQHVRTAPISGGLPAHALNLLPKAMLMTKGDVPKRAWDRAVLGDLDEKKEIKKLDKRSNLLATNTKSSASASLGSVVRPTAVSTPRGTADNRPKRKIKQRSYGDTSYEGYGEGYVDDEMVDGGYSDGDAGDRGDLKRRRKVCYTSVSVHKANFVRMPRILQARICRRVAMDRAWSEPEVSERLSTTLLRAAQSQRTDDVWLSFRERAAFHDHVREYVKSRMLNWHLV